jgi:hypothetical protein
MLEPIDIVRHLQDQEFESMELVALLNQMLRDHKEYAANNTLYLFTEGQSRFRAKRKKRLCAEFHAILEEINEMRRQAKWERSQETYRNTRKEKKRATTERIRRHMANKNNQ